MVNIHGIKRYLSVDNMANSIMILSVGPQQHLMLTRSYYHSNNASSWGSPAQH